MSAKPKQDDPAQSKRFIAAALDAEADDSDGALDRAFRKVMPSKPKSSQGKPSAK